MRCSLPGLAESIALLRFGYHGVPIDRFAHIKVDLLSTKPNHINEIIIMGEMKFEVVKPHVECLSLKRRQTDYKNESSSFWFLWRFSLTRVDSE